VAGVISEVRRPVREMRSDEASLPKEIWPRTARLPVVVVCPCLEMVKTSPVEVVVPLSRKSLRLDVPSVWRRRAVRVAVARSGEA
jgi:hypothetical protein